MAGDQEVRSGRLRKGSQVPTSPFGPTFGSLEGPLRTAPPARQVAVPLL